MSGLGNIIRKEIRELLTVATVLPIVLVALIFGTMGTSIQGIQEQALTPPVIGVIAVDNGTFGVRASEILHSSAKVVYNSTSAADQGTGIKEIEHQNGVALVVIPQNFSYRIDHGQRGILEIYWIMKGTGALDTISSSIFEQLVGNINTNISRALIKGNSSVNATFVLSPTQPVQITYFKNREFIDVSPNAIVGMLTSQSILIPIVMMMIIIMAGSIVITSMALEKENKTLETLLTLPVKRTSIVTGKIIAAALIGLLLAVIYMIGMQYYFSGLQMTGGGVSLATYRTGSYLDRFHLDRRLVVRHPHRGASLMHAAWDVCEEL